jgi:hypothetical protein
MAFVSLLVLSRIGQRAFMNFALLSSNKEGEVVKFVKIKAEPTSQSNKRSLFLLLAS